MAHSSLVNPKFGADPLRVSGGFALGVANGADRLFALVLRRPVEDQHAVEVIDLVLDDPCLEPGRFDGAIVAVLVLRTNTNVNGALDVDEDAGDREAALLGRLGVVTGPLDLGVDERHDRAVGAHAVDEQLLRDADLGGGEADAERVVHERGHAIDLVAERVVEAIDLSGPALQDRVAVAADVSKSRSAPGSNLGIEHLVLVVLIIGVGRDFDDVVQVLLCHIFESRQPWPSVRRATDSRETHAMRKLTFGMNLTLDGYIAAPGDDLGWSEPSDELFQWWSDRVATTGLALYGRKLWEAMSSHWPTADQQPGVTPAEIEFANRWREMPKVVFSSTISTVDWNTRLVTGDAVTEITKLKADDGGPMDIGGATLAAAAMRAGLIDEYLIVTHPVLVGGGTPFFTPLDNWVNLRLVETRTFPDGVVLTRYETKR